MFVGNMVTEAIPARVFALYRIVSSKKELQRSELQAFMEPPEIYEGNSYFPAILKAATELKLVNIQDNSVSLLVSKEEIKSIDDFRRYAISILPDYEEEQFWKCTNVIVNMNEDIYKYGAISDSDMLNYMSNEVGQNISAPMMRGWRFWAQFLGFGYMNGFSFLPNAYVYVKNVISLMGLEKNKEYEIDDFMAQFMHYGKIMLSSSLSSKNLNIAMSSALRQLHDSGEIVLKHGSDQDMKWILYPSSESFNQPVSTIVYKGLKK